MKKITYVFLVLCMLALTTGCGEQQSNTEFSVSVQEENMVDIYYPVDNGIVKDEAAFRFKQPDSVGASIEELMLVLSEKLGNDRIDYTTYMIDAYNNVTLDFDLVSEYNKEYYLLAKAAITSSLFQISNINFITIRLSDNKGTVISEESFDRKSFYFYGYSGM
ncbi:MAG: hypothetical protein NC225_09735 [Clostridium sp.]|nr:hypothetical protein [Clostridium sp.]MCM1399743.1 hypothetical protein [Clostridium sp.]MCM1460422.1 hypothetical protein [Bacteroides sp.]